MADENKNNNPSDGGYLPQMFEDAAKQWAAYLKKEEDLKLKLEKAEFIRQEKIKEKNIFKQYAAWKKIQDANIKANKDYIHAIKQWQDYNKKINDEQLKKQEILAERNLSSEHAQWVKEREEEQKIAFAWAAYNKAEEQEKLKKQEILAERELSNQHAQWVKEQEEEKRVASAWAAYDKAREQEKLDKQKSEADRQERIREVNLDKEYRRWKEQKAEEARASKEQLDGIKDTYANVYRGFAQIAAPVAQEFMQIKMIEAAAAINKMTGDQPWIRDLLSLGVVLGPAIASGVMSILGSVLGPFLGTFLANKTQALLKPLETSAMDMAASAVVNSATTRASIGAWIATMGTNLGAMIANTIALGKNTLAHLGLGGGILLGIATLAAFAAVNSGIDAKKRFDKGDKAGGAVAVVETGGLATLAGAIVLGVLGVLTSEIWVPIALIAAGIAAIAAGVLGIMDNWGWFKEQFSKFGNWMSNTFGGMWGWFKKTLDPKNIFKVFEESPMGLFFKILGDWISNLPGVKKGSTEAEQVVQNSWKRVVQDAKEVKEAAKPVIQGVEKAAKPVIQGAKDVLSGGKEDRTQRALIGGKSTGTYGRNSLESTIKQNKEFESLNNKKNKFKVQTFTEDIQYAKKGTSALLNSLASKGANFEISGALGTAQSRHAGKQQGTGHYSGTKLDFVPKKGETFESLEKKLKASGQFSRVAIENAGTANAHIDAQVKKSYYDNIAKQNKKQQPTAKTKTPPVINKTVKQPEKGEKQKQQDINDKLTKTSVSTGTPSNVTNNISSNAPVISTSSKSDPTGQRQFVDSLNWGINPFNK